MPSRACSTTCFLAPNQHHSSKASKPTSTGSEGCKPRWLSLTAARRIGILAVGRIAALFVGLDAAVAVKAKSSGPILLRQTRAGLNADHFECSKFRTMPYDNNPLIPDASRITSASASK